MKCVIELAVLSPAKPGALFWKVLHLHNIGEQDWICAIGETQEVIEALSGGAVLIGERCQRRSHRRVLQVLLIGMSSAQDETARIGLAELQNDVSGKLIGGILLVPEDRNVEEIEMAWPASCATA